MRKNKWRQILFLAAAAALLSGCGSKDTIKSVKKAGVLRVAVYGEESGTPVSEAEEQMLNTLAEKLGASIDKLPAETPEEAASLIERGEADIAVGSLTEEASSGRQCAATAAYASEPVLVVTRRGDYSDCIAAFEGRGLGAQPQLSGTAETLEADQKERSIDTSIDEEEAASRLKAGSMDGYICLRSTAEHLIETDGDVLQAQMLIAAEPQEYCALVPAKDRKFRQGVNQIIQMMDEPEETQAEE